MVETIELERKDLGIRPMAGFAYLLMDSFFGKTEGGIVIPGLSRRIHGYQGVCVSFAPHVNGRLKRHKWPDMVGMVCVTKSAIGQIFHYEKQSIMRIPLESIEAILTREAADRLNLKVLRGNNVERCRFCKSAGEGNIMLQNGYCSQCGLDQYGKLPPDVTIDTEEERAIWLGEPAPR